MTSTPQSAIPAAASVLPEETLSFKLLRNSASNILRGMVSLPIALVLTPMVIGALGIRDFGIWALVFVFVQSGMLFDLGMSGSLIKFVAQYNEKEEYEELNRALSSAFVVYLALAVGMAGALWLARGALVEALFKAEPGDPRLMLMLSLAAGAFFVQLLFAPFYSVLQGLQRIDVANGLLVAVQVVHFALAVGALWLGYGLVALAAAQGIAVALGGLGAMVTAHRLCPQFRWGMRWVRWESLRQLLPLSFSLQGLSLQTLVFYQFDKIALSAYLGPVYAGYYDAASRPLASLRNIPLALVQPVMPAVSELQARNDRQRIERIFLLACRVIVVLAAPVFLAIVFLARPLLELWLADRVQDGLDIITWNVRLLALAYLANVSAAAISFVAAGVGNARVLFRYAGLASLLQIVLTLLGLRLLGYMGAPLGILAGTAVAVAYYFWEFQRSSGMAGGRVVKAVWKPLMLAGLLAGATSAALLPWPHPSGALLGGMVAVYFVAYGAGAWRLKCVTREEVERVAEFLARTSRGMLPRRGGLLHSVARVTLRALTAPERRVKQALVRRFGPAERSDQLTVRTALVWGWGLDRMRRNIAVAGRVREVQQKGRLRVLDVGAADGGVRPFLPPDAFDVCSVDLDWKRLAAAGCRGTSVCADGSRLPFADGSFDVAVSVDCLEHVPRERREEFLKELARVARRRVVLHFPADDGEDFQGARFEAAFRRRFLVMGRRDQNIEEHVEWGLPDAFQVARRFPGCAVQGRENGTLWLKYMLLERVPYVSFLTGVWMLGARSRLDAPPYHAALVVYDVGESGDVARVTESAAEVVAD